MKTSLLIQRIALGLAVLWIFGATQGWAQATLNIGFPKDGSVFQQEQNGVGRIQMLGYFNSQAYQSGYYQLTASLTPLNVRTGTPTGNAFGTLAVQQLDGGFITCGFHDIPGGWYSLNVVAQPLNPSDNLPTITKTIKVGIGEVFIIGGQSNTQGLPNTAASQKVGAFFGPLDGVRVQAQFSPSEGGVAAANLYDATAFFNDYSLLPDLTSVSDNPNAGIGPSGPSLWLWARLGQKLVDQYSVPVAFYNAAYGSTTITEWARSTNPAKRVAGRSVPNDQNPTNVYPVSAPYSLLQKTIKLYGSLYGVRAVLWQQGETDTDAINDQQDSWGHVTVTNFDQSQETYLRRVDYFPIS